MQLARSLPGRVVARLQRIVRSEWSTRAALRRAAMTIRVNSVIDVGASDGRWSRMAKGIWPDARCLLIEAQPGHLAALDASGMEYVLAAAGDRIGDAQFDASDLLGGVASHSPTGGEHDIMVPMTTVDAEVQRVGLEPPFLLKLDTHGFEREILAGAEQTLAASTLLVIEAYNFEFRPGAPRFHELCLLLEDKGFRCLDLADPMHRSLDGALWQVDLVFARADRSEFSNAGYL